MSNTKNFYFLSIVFILSFFPLTAPEARAAEVYFAPYTGDIHPNDIFVLEARISSPDELINVADGAFLFDTDALEVKELSVGGSAFSLWAHGPSFSNTTGRVNFVGGIPDGFQHKDGLILKAIFRAKQEGETALFFESGFSLLLSDGNGTSIRPQTHPITLHIAERPAQGSPKDEWKDFLGADTTPPKFIEAILSKDPQFFNNKYFVSFFATDEQTGVAYYEIKEGSRSFVRAVSPYVLQDQALGETVQIKSIDSAGNESVTTLERMPVPSAPLSTTALFWVAMLVSVVLAITIFLRLRVRYQKLK